MSAALFLARAERVPRSLAAEAVAMAAIRRLFDREAVITRDAEGRPLARWADNRGDRAPSLSISYAGGHICVAVAEQGGIGVDIEPACSVGERVARRVMSPVDLDRFDRLAPSSRKAAATRYWTCLEALVKAAGAGLSQMLTRTRVLGFDSRGECEGHSFAVRAAGAGLICALAAERVDDVAACFEDVTRLDDLALAGPRR